MTDILEQLRVVEKYTSISGKWAQEGADEITALRARIASLEAERDALKHSLEFRRERQAQREQTLFDWAHRELKEPQLTQYFNIVANGTPSVYDNPTYAQQLNAMKHRAEAAEAALARSKGDAP